MILGHLMAHELGHLLLGEAGHPAGSGIMHVPWQTKELEQIKQGVMSFLPEQAQRIRAQVFARMMARPASRAEKGTLEATRTSGRKRSPPPKALSRKSSHTPMFNWSGKMVSRMRQDGTGS